MAGTRYERRLVRMFIDDGWGVVRSPSSGSGRVDNQPDLVVAKPPTGLGPLGIEAKTTAKEARTIPASEVDGLEDWCLLFGAEPVIAMYWKGPPGGNVSYGGWYFRRTDGVRRSPMPNAVGGHHLRPRREDRDQWAQLRDLNRGRFEVTDTGAVA